MNDKLWPENSFEMASKLRENIVQFLLNVY